MSLLPFQGNTKHCCYHAVAFTILLADNQHTAGRNIIPPCQIKLFTSYVCNDAVLTTKQCPKIIDFHSELRVDGSTGKRSQSVCVCVCVCVCALLCVPVHLFVAVVPPLFFGSFSLPMPLFISLHYFFRYTGKSPKGISLCVK